LAPVFRRRLAGLCSPFHPSKIAIMSAAFAANSKAVKTLPQLGLMSKVLPHQDRQGNKVSPGVCVILTQL
jgi:hypothetical protein